jgi:hypothetical protein
LKSKAKRNNILKLFGEGPMEKTKKLEKTKKKQQYIETLGWALHIPKTSGVF